MSTWKERPVPETDRSNEDAATTAKPSSSSVVAQIRRTLQTTPRPVQVDYARSRPPTGCVYGCPQTHHVERCPLARRDHSRFHCDRCLTFSVGEREQLERCWYDARCPLAGAIVGGDR